MTQRTQTILIVTVVLVAVVIIGLVSGQLQGVFESVGALFS